MAAKAQVSEDLVHTMSKKIAQLTKVIYLLNTKSDENDYEVKCVRDSHENDVKDVLDDAHAKMVAFQRKLTSSSDAQDDKTREVIEGMKKKHAEEKKKALETLQQLKQKAQEVCFQYGFVCLYSESLSLRVSYRMSERLSKPPKMNWLA
jgi:hypothetical protein